MTAMGILSEVLLNQEGQTGPPLAHVGMPGRDPYPDARGNWDHGLTDRSTTDSSLGESPAGMRTIARSLIEANDLAQAIEMMSRPPCAVAHGVVEVWPLEEPS